MLACKSATGALLHGRGATRVSWGWVRVLAWTHPAQRSALHDLLRLPAELARPAQPAVKAAGPRQAARGQRRAAAAAAAAGAGSAGAARASPATGRLAACAVGPGPCVAVAATDRAPARQQSEKRRAAGDAGSWDSPAPHECQVSLAKYWPANQGVQGTMPHLHTLLARNPAHASAVQPCRRPLLRPPQGRQSCCAQQGADNVCCRQRRTLKRAQEREAAAASAAAAAEAMAGGAEPATGAETLRSHNPLAAQSQVRLTAAAAARPPAQGSGRAALVRSAQRSHPACAGVE